MKLVHYSDQVITVPRTRYSQRDVSMAKPRGFWLSDDSDYGWRQWCEAEDFRTERLRYAHTVTLKQDANILYIQSDLELDNFTNKYGANGYLGMFNITNMMCIDWFKVSKLYQGIIITPYLWQRRLDFGCGWYYGWDCASGCIRDTSCIETIKCSKTRKRKEKEII